MTSLPLTGAGITYSYLLRDAFNIADAAPVASPRTCEPGPGTLTFVETDGTFAISGGKLVFTKQTTPNWGDQGFYSENGVTRTAGRTLLATASVSGGASGTVFWLSWAISKTIVFNVMANMEGHILFEDDAGVKNLYTQESVTAYRIVGNYVEGQELAVGIILRATGYFLIDKTNGKLLWVSTNGTTATLYPAMSNYNKAGTIDNFRVPKRLWIPTPLVSDSFTRADSSTIGASAGGGGEESGGTGVSVTEVAGDWAISSNKLVTVGASPGASNWVATWAAGRTAVVVQVDVTLQANSLAGVILSSDGTDWYRVAIDDAANVIRIHEYDGAGTYTQRASTAATIAAATSYPLFVVRDGATIKGYVANERPTVIYTSAAVNDTATAHGLAAATAGDAFDNLVIWNRNQTMPSF